MAPIALLLLLIAPPGDPADEIQWTEQTLARIQDLRTKTEALQAELEDLIQGLRERKVALSAYKPPPPPAFGGVGGNRVDPLPPKRTFVRCAARTGSGEQCSRSAVAGQRYCSQHENTRKK